MSKKDVSKKIPIYQINTSKEVLKYYKKWTTKEQFNKDMVEWDYTAPVNAVSLITRYALKKNIKINCVITSPGMKSGRGLKLNQSEVKKYSELNKIKILEPDN